VPITLQNPGNASTNATMYLLNSSHMPPATQPVTLTASTGSVATTLTVPAQSVVALQFAAQTPPPDFSATVNPTSASIKAGQQAQFTLTVSPIGGLNQPVNLSCSGAPQNATCSISPTSVTLDGTNPATATVTVSTKSATAAASLMPFGVSPWGVGLSLLALVWLSGSRPAMRRSARTAGAVLALTMLVACGGGGGGGGSSSNPGSQPPPPSSNPGTPTGSYTLTVTETSGSISHVTQIPITVQ
jgi:hypothetical protein